MCALSCESLLWNAGDGGLLHARNAFASTLLSILSISCPVIHYSVSQGKDERAPWSRTLMASSIPATWLCRNRCSLLIGGDGRYRRQSYPPGRWWRISRRAPFPLDWGLPCVVMWDFGCNQQIGPPQTLSRLPSNEVTSSHLSGEYCL